MLAAQHAPIGAKICTTRAIRTMGRKFFSRLRIANPFVSEPNHPQKSEVEVRFPVYPRVSRK